MILGLIIVILAGSYIIPYKGFCRLNKREKKFLDNYKGFTLLEPIEISNAEDLTDSISFDKEGNVPTIQSFGSLDNDGSNNSYTDIDISL